MATLERFQVEVEEKGNLFIIGLLEKQHTRLKMLFDRHVVRNSSGQNVKQAFSMSRDRLLN
jgi:CRISPR/Cas system-associated protein endoribonuclease Cas2